MARVGQQRHKRKINKKKQINIIYFLNKRRKFFYVCAKSVLFYLT